MRKMKRTLLIIIAAIVAGVLTTATAQTIQRKRLVNPDSIPDELVLVGEDTVHMIIRQAN